MPNYLDQEGLGYYDGKMKVYMSNAISSAVAATYKPGGSRTFEQLPSLVAEYVGFIYNITNDFTTTSDFVEGAGTFCKAGANVGIVNVGTNQSPVYKYDLFSAFVDLSNYATLDDLPTKTSDLTNDSGYASAFTGTTTQWNSLTDAQKAKYELVCLTDDLGDSDNVKDLMVNKAQATVIARQDEAATASRSYVVGDFVYRDNVLYKVTAAISTGDSFVVGTNISTTTVEAELSNKVDKVEGKGLSTNDYDNTEKGKVADNTSAIEAIVNEYSAKNLLPNYAGNAEIHGVTFTVRDDGSILINGTATNSVWYNFCYIDFGSGTMNTWDHPYSATNGLIISSGNPNIGMQYEGRSKATYIAIGPGVTIDNQIAYPMIRDARIKDDTYVPYAMTNRELTERVKVTKGTYTSDSGLATISVTKLDGYYLAGVTCNHAGGYLCSFSEHSSTDYYVVIMDFDVANNTISFMKNFETELILTWIKE